MKKTLAMMVVAMLCSGAMGATLVGQWNNFNSLTSTVAVNESTSLALALTGSSAVDENGVLNVVGASGGSAKVDLTNAGLNMTDGLTISLTVSNVGSFSGGTPYGIFALSSGTATNLNSSEGSWYFLCGVENNAATTLKLSHKGSTGHIYTSNAQSMAAVKESTPALVTASLTSSAISVYLNGELVGTGGRDDGDFRSPAITALALGSWVGGSSNSLLSESVHSLSIYNGAMTADEVKALASVPEPATATLSLLALAGLCARRRH